MNPHLFDNAKFGDMFLTNENTQAVFLRFQSNPEYAKLYVENFGPIVVHTLTGERELYGEVPIRNLKIERRKKK